MEGPVNQTVSSKIFLGPAEHLDDLLQLRYDDDRLPAMVDDYFNVNWFYVIWLVEIIVKENDTVVIEMGQKEDFCSNSFSIFLELCLLDLPDLIFLLQSRDTLIGQIRPGIPEYQSFQISVLKLQSLYSFN